MPGRLGLSVLRHGALHTEYKLHPGAHAPHQTLQAREAWTIVQVPRRGVDALLKRLDDISDEGIRKTVRNAGGGYVNHDVFFHSMSPTGGGSLEGDGLAGELVRTYGSVMRFKQAFTLAALEVFGSGWAWLVYDVREKGLRITSTSNQDTPAMQEGMVPLLALDVWEHAYYLKHQSRRKDYIEAFWEVVNWLEVATRLEAAVEQAAQLEDKPEL